MTAPAPITHLLRAWSEGDDAALAALVPLVDSELRRLAAGYMGANALGIRFSRLLSSTRRFFDCSMRRV